MLVVKNVTSKKLWEKFVKKKSDGNFLQSWNWGNCNKNIGFKIFRIGLYRKNKLIGVCLTIKKNAKRGTYLELPGGPLIDFSQSLHIDFFLKKLISIAKKEECSFIRVRPQILNNLTNQLIFKNKGFNSAPIHLHAESTWQLDLDKSELNLQSKMRKSTRYLTKKAIKMGIKVKKTNNSKDINLLFDLQKQTVKWQKFTPFPKSYFMEEFKAFNADNQIKIFKAEYKKQILSCALIIFYNKEAVYHYSGSSSLNRKMPGSYILLWEAIRFAKRKKCKIFNFWGISPKDKHKHRFSGVTLFKKGFGGYRVDFLHAQDFPINSKYYLIYIFEWLRGKYRNL